MDFLLQKKSNIFGEFKEFKALLENKTEKKMKVLRKINGGEFCMNELEEL